MRCRAGSVHRPLCIPLPINPLCVHYHIWKHQRRHDGGATLGNTGGGVNLTVGSGYTGKGGPVEIEAGESNEATGRPVIITRGEGTASTRGAMAMRSPNAGAEGVRGAIVMGEGTTSAGTSGEVPAATGGSVTITSGDSTATTNDAITVRSPNAGAESVSGVVVLDSGNTTSDTRSIFRRGSGAATPGAGGAHTAFGNTGAVAIGSGAALRGTRGNLSMTVGDGETSEDGLVEVAARELPAATGGSVTITCAITMRSPNAYYRGRHRGHCGELGRSCIDNDRNRHRTMAWSGSLAAGTTSTGGSFALALSTGAATTSGAVTDGNNAIVTIVLANAGPTGHGRVMTFTSGSTTSGNAAAVRNSSGVTPGGTRGGLNLTVGSGNISEGGPVEISADWSVSLAAGAASTGGSFTMVAGRGTSSMGETITVMAGVEGTNGVALVTAAERVGTSDELVAASSGAATDGNNVNIAIVSHNAGPTGHYRIVIFTSDSAAALRGTRGNLSMTVGDGETSEDGLVEVAARELPAATGGSVTITCAITMRSPNAYYRGRHRGHCGELGTATTSGAITVRPPNTGTEDVSGAVVLGLRYDNLRPQRFSAHRKLTGRAGSGRSGESHDGNRRPQHGRDTHVGGRNGRDRRSCADGGRNRHQTTADWSVSLAAGAASTGGSFTMVAGRGTSSMGETITVMAGVEGTNGVALVTAAERVGTSDELVAASSGAATDGNNVNIAIVSHNAGPTGHYRIVIFTSDSAAALRGTRGNLSMTVGSGETSEDGLVEVAARTTTSATSGMMRTVNCVAAPRAGRAVSLTVGTGTYTGGGTLTGDALRDTGRYRNRTTGNGYTGEGSLVATAAGITSFGPSRSVVIKSGAATSGAGGAVGLLVGTSAYATGGTLTSAADIGVTEVDAGKSTAATGRSVTITNGAGTATTSGAITIRRPNIGVAGLSGAIFSCSGTTDSGPSGMVLIGSGAAMSGAGGAASLTVGTGAYTTGETLTLVAGTDVTGCPVSMAAGTGTTSTETTARTCLVEVAVGESTAATGGSVTITSGEGTVTTSGTIITRSPNAGAEGVKGAVVWGLGTTSSGTNGNTGTVKIGSGAALGATGGDRALAEGSGNTGEADLFEGAAGESIAATRRSVNITSGDGTANTSGAITIRDRPMSVT
ncbi:unnamed protein product [Ectocarpus sp. CCAP 1310/34]|nr:unnamed protein product [Ectocarpus sp. CCAP 1310/34]